MIYRYDIKVCDSCCCCLVKMGKKGKGISTTKLMDDDNIRSRIAASIFLDHDRKDGTTVSKLKEAYFGTDKDEQMFAILNQLLTMSVLDSERQTISEWLEDMLYESAPAHGNIIKARRLLLFLIDKNWLNPNLCYEKISATEEIIGETCFVLKALELGEYEVATALISHPNFIANRQILDAYNAHLAPADLIRETLIQKIKQQESLLQLLQSRKRSADDDGESSSRLPLLKRTRYCVEDE